MTRDPRTNAPGQDKKPDKNLDLVVSNFASFEDISILLGDGTGSFGPATSFDTGGIKSYSVAVGDFNGDANLDLAVANFYSPNDVSILLGDGIGSFGPKIDFPVGGNPTSIVADNFG